MKRLEIIIGKPVKITIKSMDNDYSGVYLYWPTNDEGEPLIAPKKQWYVWYYFRSPITGKMEKFKDTCKINRYKTAKERMEAGEAWVKAYGLLLDNGFNPFDALGIPDKDMPEEIEGVVYTVKTGLKYAYDNKLGSWKKSTADDYLIRMNVFLEYAELKKFDNMDIRELADVHIIGFLNWIINPKGRNIGKTSRDNYLKIIVLALLSVLKYPTVLM